MKLHSLFPFLFAVATVTPILVCFCGTYLVTFLGSDNSSSRVVDEKWIIPEPNLEVRRNSNTIVLKYSKDGSSNTSNTNIGSIVLSSISLWSKECQTGGGTEIKLRDNGSVVILENNPDISAASFSIALDQLWSEHRENEVSIINSDVTSSTATKETRSIDFCVRYALGARTIDDSDNDESGAVEMDFVESVVTATMLRKKKQVAIKGEEKVDSSLFEISTVTVASNAQQQDNLPGRHQQTLFLHTHDIEVFFGLGDEDDNTPIVKNNNTPRWNQQVFFYRDYAVKVFFCHGDDGNTPMTGKFGMASLVTLCVQPLLKDAGSIRVSSIEDFTWTKTGTKPCTSTKADAMVITQNTFSNVTSNNPQNFYCKSDDNILIVSQEAIRDGTAVILTQYDGCSDASFCKFGTILKSDFYKSKGRIHGKASLSIEFVTRGKLSNDGGGVSTRIRNGSTDSHLPDSTTIQQR